MQVVQFACGGSPVQVSWRVPWIVGFAGREWGKKSLENHAFASIPHFLPT
jgi:hypothetical protein